MGAGVLKPPCPTGLHGMKREGSEKSKGRRGREKRRGGRRREARVPWLVRREGGERYRQSGAAQRARAGVF